MQMMEMDEEIRCLKEYRDKNRDYPVIWARCSRRLIELYRLSGEEAEYKRELTDYVLHHRPELELYRELKSISQEAEWEAIREELFAGAPYDSANYIYYAEEGLYERILDGLRHSGIICQLDRYEPLLREHYPARILQMYEEYVVMRSEPATDRNTYRHLVEYLKKMKSYPGGEERVEMIVQYWKARYGRRRAMMEELEQLE